jgi:hypothetical protein
MRTLILITLVCVVIIGCKREYSGDGKYVITKYEGPLWFNFYNYDLTLPEIALSKEGTYNYVLRNYCSTNSAFGISLEMVSSKEERWWDSSTSVNLRLVDSKNHIILERRGPLNGYNTRALTGNCTTITYQACPPDEGQWTAYYVVQGRYGEGSAIAVWKDGIPTKTFAQGARSETVLGCDEYRLLVEIRKPHFDGEVSGHLRVISGWK